MNILVAVYVDLMLFGLLWSVGWFVVAMIRKRNDIADIAWGLGFLAVAIITYWRGGVTFDRALLVTCLVAIWALRLSTHIYLRHRGRGEDARYRAWRDDWGRWFTVRSYLQIFLLQTILMLIVVSPVVIVNTYRGPQFGWLESVGIVVWLTGFVFETVGDWQLKRFIANPANKGHVLTTGLWRYSRHPNYFGEVMGWWGIWLIALSVPYGWLGIVGPIMITLLITAVSGIPMLEKRKAGDPEFEEYKRTTSVFFPLPPAVIKK